MRKSILIVLLVIFALTLWTVVAFGKAKKDEPAKQPSQVQKTEQNVEPQFLKVAPTVLAAKNALVISGTRNDWELSATVNKARSKYQNAGWNVVFFESYNWPDPYNDLRLIVTYGGPWNAIYEVAHGSFYEPEPGHQIAIFSLDKPGTGDVVVYIDTLAKWFEQSASPQPDEIILQSCYLGKRTGLAGLFNNPRYLLAWDHPIDAKVFILYEYLYHRPPSGGQSAFGLSRSQLAAKFTSSPVLSDCIGNDCYNDSCINFAPQAQEYVDLALEAMAIAVSYLETDPIQAITKLEEARQYFYIALGYEFDDYNRWILQSHIDDIDFILIPKKQTGEVDGSNIDELNNNTGGLDGMDVLFGSKVVSPLYKGSLFSGTSQADLRGDYGDYYPTQSFTPLEWPVETIFTIAGKAGDYFIQMLTNNWSHADLPGMDYNMYAFGVTVPAGGGEDIKYVIEDVYVLENDGIDPIIGLQKALLFDYDIGASNDCVVDWDQQHASMWMYDAVAPDTVFGLTEIPVVKGTAPITGWGILNPVRIYDGQYVDSMKYWMEGLGWGTDPYGTGDDMSLLMADEAFDLQPGAVHIKKYIKWGYNNVIATGGDANWRHFLYNILQTLGYYRGDVNKDGKCSVSDVVYLINYLFKNGPKPIEFVDQGNVNNDGNTNVTDVVYLINYLFKGGCAPIDKERLYEAAPIPANHKGLTVRESLFNDPAWRALGQ